METIEIGPGAAPAAAARAAESLRRGGLVVLPTETLYGLACAATDAAALDRLWRARGGDARAALAWHLPTGDALIAALWGDARPPPVHRRLVERLTPGPVTFAVPMEPDRLAAVRRRAGIAQGASDDGRELLARVPSHPLTQEILAAVGAPVVIATIETGRGPARTPGEAAEALRATGGDAHTDLLLADGPARIGRQSTLVRLLPDGGFEVARRGAYEERYIRKQLVRTILFVCTGNTCRSPMAEAIARHLLERAGPGAIETRVRSAGVAAAHGAPATEEAVEAVRALGAPMTAHRSAPLTREHTAEADVIYAMTRAHAEAVRRLDPSAAAKVRLLDPAGDDIPDPIGRPRAEYDESARRIMHAVQARLLEDDPGPAGGAPHPPGA